MTVQPRMIAVISPAPLTTSLRWATGELSKISGLYQGRIVGGDRATEEGDRDHQRRIKRQRPEIRRVGIDHAHDDRRDHDVEQGDDRHRAPFGHLGRVVRQDPVERRSEDHPRRRQEEGPGPAEEPHAEQDHHPDLEDRVVDEVRHEQRWIAPDRNRRGCRRVAIEVVDEVRVGRGEEVPAERLRGQEHEGEREGRGDPDPPSMPRRTLRKSPEPRTSPYSVEPQFGYRIQKSMNGIIASVANRVSESSRRSRRGERRDPAVVGGGVGERLVVGAGDPEHRSRLPGRRPP